MAESLTEGSFRCLTRYLPPNDEIKAEPFLLNTVPGYICSITTTLS